MAKSAQELVSEIRRQAKGRIGESELSALLEEVRSHLEASIQAHLEMGQAPETAEMDAVEDFGSPARFVRQVLREHPGRRNFRGHWALCSLITIGAYVWISDPFLLAGEFSGTELQIAGRVTIVIAFVVSLGVLAKSSWRSRSWPWMRLSLTGLSWCLFIAAVTGLAYIGAPEKSTGQISFGLFHKSLSPTDPWPVARWDVNTTIGWLRVGDTYRMETTENDAIRDLFFRGRSAVQHSPYYSNGAYFGWKELFRDTDERPEAPGFIVQNWTTDFHAALESWKIYDNSVRDDVASAGFRLAEDESNIATIQRARTRTFDPQMFGLGFWTGLTFAGSGLALSFIVWTMGKICDLNRRLRKEMYATP